MKKSASLFLTAIAAISGTLLTGCVDGPKQPTTDPVKSAFQLQLLHFADVDGGRNIIDNAPRFSAILNKFRSEMKDNTIVLSSGDNWIPGPEYNVAADKSLNATLGKASSGHAHVAWLNALGVQASVIGNHELDLGTKSFAKLLTAKDAWQGAAFPYLATNLDFTSDKNTKPLIGQDGALNTALGGKLSAYTVVMVGKERIGVIGASTPTLSKITSTGDLKVQPSNADDIDALAALIQADADALTAKGINKIILLAHMQKIVVEKALASKLKNVDIIVAGGSNTILADQNDRLRTKDSAQGTYPLSYKGKDGNPVLVVNTDGDYTYLGRLVADFDKNGVLLTDKLDDKINGAYATDEKGLQDLKLSSNDAIPKVKAISTELKKALSTRAGNIVGYTNVYLNGERRGVRQEETNLGNLSADANLAYAKTIDSKTSISLKNGGGIRAAIGACIVPPGSTGQAVCGAPKAVEGISPDKAISQLDLEIAFRFNNNLTLVTVNGDLLHKVLEHSVKDVENMAGAFPQVAGLDFTFDPKLAKGKRITTLNATDSSGNTVAIVKGGKLQDKGAKTDFRLVTLGFLAGGGDGYPYPKKDTEAFKAFNLVNLEKEGTKSGKATFADDGTEQDALAEYLLKHHGTAAKAYNVADTPKDKDTRIRQ